MTKLLPALALAAALFPAPSASAAGVPSVVTAKGAGEYVPGTDPAVPVVLVQGGTLVFVNLDPSNRHTVDADPPFALSSDELSFGQAAIVEGTEALPPGTYPFYCRVHVLTNGMRGTIEVKALP